MASKGEGKGAVKKKRRVREYTIRERRMVNIDMVYDMTRKKVTLGIEEGVRSGSSW